MTLNGVTVDRLGDRVNLMRSSSDSLNRSLDRGGTMDGIDSQLPAASSRHPDLVAPGGRRPRPLEGRPRASWAASTATTIPRSSVTAPAHGARFCIARAPRVEAGARVVTLNFSRWDWHGPDGKNFVESRRNMPLLDAAVSALVEDLHVRGLHNDVSVVVWGEFGRTPRINNTEGRDHWPQLSCALLAGGGMKTGQFIGTSDRNAGLPARRPVKFQEIFATLYRNIGLDPLSTRIFDQNGRPQYLVDQGNDPLPEVI